MSSSQNRINWRLPNTLTYIIIILIGAALHFDLSGLSLAFLTGQDITSFSIGILAILMRENARLYAYKIERFQPVTTLDAKRANEQIKSLANAISGIAAGGVIAVAVKQLPKDQPDYILTAIALVIAFWIHTGARDLLGLLKDESVRNGDASVRS